MLDVKSGKVEEAGVVLELPETAIAVETQQRPHSSRLVVMVDVNGWSSAADGAQSVLLLEHRVGFLASNAVAAT